MTRPVFKGLIGRWTFGFFFRDVIWNILKECCTIKFVRAHILICVMCSCAFMRKETSSLDCLFHSDFMCFLASGHLICLCSSHSTFCLCVSFEAQPVSSHSYMKNRQNNRPQPLDLPNWMGPHFLFIPLYVNQGSLLPDSIKAICFVLWNVRSTGEAEQKSVDRGRGPPQQQRGK